MSLQTTFLWKSFSRLGRLTSNLLKVPVKSNYFYIEDYADFTVEDSNTACESNCIDDDTCVQMVYFTKDYVDFNGTLLAPQNSCYLLDQVNMPLSIYKTTGVVITGLGSKIKKTRSLCRNRSWFSTSSRSISAFRGHGYWRWKLDFSARNCDPVWIG